MIDIEKARDLLAQLKTVTEITYSLPLVIDTIAALIAEVEWLKTVPMKYRRMAFNAQLQEENALLLAERDALAREVDACAAALPGPYYMDPPDGGDVSISEQLRRMARDAARYRWLRQPNPLHREAHIAVLTHNGGWVASGERADAAIDAAMKGASDE